MQLLAGTIFPATATNVVPDYVRSLTPISEPRLSMGVSNAEIGVNVSGSTTAWYLAADSVDTIIYATLDGQQGPRSDTRQGFDIDGVEVKCAHDFGVAAADYRGLFKNNGA